MNRVLIISSAFSLFIFCPLWSPVSGDHNDNPLKVVFKTKVTAHIISLTITVTQGMAVAGIHI